MGYIELDRMVITDEVFRILQDGGTIRVMPSTFQPDENQMEPNHAALFDEAGQFLDWLF